MTQPEPGSDLVDVAIVGAGPVGLALALGLARHEVRSVLLERRADLNEQSRAPVVHVRTREVLRQWGVEERFVRAGLLRRELAVVSSGGRGRTVFSLDFSELSEESEDPGFLFLEQAQTERLLLQAVNESDACDVRYGADVIGLDVGPQLATLKVREGAGTTSLRARFVVGCDGAGSFVRDALNLPFEGITYAIRPMLADVRISDERDSLPWPRLLNEKDGLTFTLRLSNGLWRLVRLERGESRRGEAIPDDEVRARASAILGEGPMDVVWSSRFRIHRRSSPRFRVGRVLLAGDAAHVHSPAGGLGMNGGIQDAHNLAWKLAAVLNGGDESRLLDSYDTERRAVVVESTSRYTDIVTRAFVQTPAAVRAGAFFLLRVALTSRTLRRRMLRRSTMLDLAYPPSPLLRKEDRKAGARLPNPLMRSPDGVEIRLHDLLPAAAAMVVLSDDAGDVDALPLRFSLRHVVRVGAGAYHDASGSLDRLAGEGVAWILVRPDVHIAWIRHSRDGMAEAVSHALGIP